MDGIAVQNISNGKFSLKLAPSPSSPFRRRNLITEKMIVPSTTINKPAEANGPRRYYYYYDCPYLFHRR